MSHLWCQSESYEEHQQSVNDVPLSNQKGANSRQ